MGWGGVEVQMEPRGTYPIRVGSNSWECGGWSMIIPMHEAVEVEVISDGVFYCANEGVGVRIVE